MRPIIVGVCVVAAACSGQVSDSPTAPTSATRAAEESPARSGAELPFSGSFTMESKGVLNCPPTCPPTKLVATVSEEGTASHLGHFSATSVDNVDLATTTSTGTITFIAANGDRLFAETAGGEDRFTPPNVSHVTLTARIVGGTGRFAGSTGTFTFEFEQVIDYAAATSSGSGSFEGTITLGQAR
jgi:hypothetical protein